MRKVESKTSTDTMMIWIIDYSSKLRDTLNGFSLVLQLAKGAKKYRHEYNMRGPNFYKRRSFFFSFLIFLIFALTLTFPLINNFSARLPIGSESSGTVPFLNTWIINWNREQFTSFYGDYWNAPIFYPSQGALAFSEPQAGTILISAIAGLFGIGVAYNSVLLTYLTLNGFCAYLLFRHWKITPLGSTIGGLIIMALPFLTHERGVLQLQIVFPFLLALLLLERVKAHKRLSDLLLLGFIVGASVYFSETNALVFGFGISIYSLFRFSSSPKFLLHMLLALAVAGAIALPLLIPQSIILSEMGFSRSDNSILAGSAEFSDYLNPSSTIFIEKAFDLSSSNFGLFPGSAMLLAAMAYLLIEVRNNGRPKYLLALLATLILAFALSLGLNLELLGVAPYKSLIAYMPGFEHIRSPFRFGILPQITLAIFSTFFIDKLLSNKKNVLAILFSLVILIEIFPRPNRLAQLPEIPQLTTAESPALFLPYVQGRSSTAYTQSTRWMLIALQNDLDIVNGYSGYFPSQNRQLKIDLEGFPSIESLEAIEALGVKSIILNEMWLNNDLYARLAEAPFSELFRKSENVGGLLVYQLIK